MCRVVSVSDTTETHLIQEVFVLTKLNHQVILHYSTKIKL